MASDSVRGTAIETLAQYLWATPELLEELKPSLPALMSEQHPAIQAKLAMLCYAIAFKGEHRDLATELFVRLMETPTDEHVLSSHWSFRFMHACIVDSWPTLRTILERMMRSESSEIRNKAARLVCIAVVSGVDALDLAKQCVASSDPKVRAACADVLSYNLDKDAGKPWITETVLALADDPNMEVCRAVSSGFQGRRRSLDFAPLADFLPKYVKSRAFIRGAGSLIDAITESHAVLPSLILDLIESAITRANEPVEEDADRIVWHLQSLSAVLTRIYHENRDGPLRRRTLNLIDKLCIQGTINPDTLDQ